MHFETKIYQHIFEQFNDKTIICAIHRLHLLDAFDDIYLLADGKIVGHGTLDELKQHPHYQQMWRHYTRQLHDKQHGTGG